MKKLLFIAFVVLISAAVVKIKAQSSLTVSPGSTLASCPSPSTKALIFCNVAGDSANADGAYVSANGAAYFRVSASVSAGVTSFNGRTGAITLTKADITGTGIAAASTTTATTTASTTTTLQ